MSKLLILAIVELVNIFQIFVQDCKMKIDKVTIFSGKTRAGNTSAFTGCHLLGHFLALFLLHVLHCTQGGY